MALAENVPFKWKLIVREKKATFNCTCIFTKDKERDTFTSSARLNLLSCRSRMYSDFTRFRQQTGPFSDFFPVWPMIILKAMVSYQNH